MDSIVKPILTQLKAINTHYDQIVRGLATGDPAARQMLNDLAKEIRQIFAHTKSTTNSLNANLAAAPGLQPSTMMKTITYYAHEVGAVVQVLIQITVLVTNILSLRTIIDFIMQDLIAAQKWLQTQMLWIERAVNRAAQKVQKNIEWVKRGLSIDVSEAYSNAQLQFYTSQLQTAQKAQSDQTTTNATSTTTTPTAQQTAATKAIADQQKAVVTSLQSKVDSIKADLASYPAQRQAITDDKTYWNARWDKEAQADKDALKNNIPLEGVNYGK